MPRPHKQGLDYFPLDVSFDDNVELLETKEGAEGFVILIRLWQKIYATNGYYIDWDNNNSLLFSKKTGYEHEKILSTVSTCLEHNIFNPEKYEKYSILTSRGIQDRYFTACISSRRKHIKIVKEFTLLDMSGVNTEFIPLGKELLPTLTPQRERERESEIENEIEKESNKTLVYERIVKFYNDNRKDLPEVQKITPKRKSAINSRLKEYSENDIQTVILKARDSDFLSGRSGKWQASFDWLMNPNNFVKVLEGNYDKKDIMPKAFRTLMEMREAE